jgi:hypothetical protein
MHRIYCYDLPNFREKNVATLNLHKEAAIIHVDEIGHFDPAEGKTVFGIHLWAIVDPFAALELRRFWLVRDGDVLSALGEEPWLFHIGSWRGVTGTLWQHLFEITHVPDFDPPKRERKVKRTWRPRTQASKSSTNSATESA